MTERSAGGTTGYHSWMPSPSVDPGELLLRAFNGWWRRRLARQLGSLGAGSFIAWPVSIYDPKRVFLGEGVTIRAGARLDAVRATPDAEPGRIVVGHRTVMMERCSVASAAAVEIEHDVLFGANVAVRDADHGFSVPDRHRASEPLVGASPVRIGAFAWIGQNAVVLKGVTIGRNSVVGANSVVTHSVEEGAIVAGVPARQIGWADGRPFKQNA
jgi:acetyltransferase-like isoleucine patch superfamily enzyme